MQNPPRVYGGGIKINRADVIRKMDNAALAKFIAEVADWTFEVDFGSDAEKWEAWQSREVEEGGE